MTIIMKEKVEKLDLVELRPREKGVVVAINDGDSLVRRLETLGVRIGAEITKISAQLMRGPVIVRIGSTQVALGFGMARKVIVEHQGQVHKAQEHKGTREHGDK